MNYVYGGQGTPRVHGDISRVELDEAVNYVYAVNEESYDDFLGQGIVAVFTSKEAIERAFPEIKWEWETSAPNTAEVGWAARGRNGVNAYVVYYLPVDEVSPEMS